MIWEIATTSSKTTARRHRVQGKDLAQTLFLEQPYLSFPRGTPSPDLHGGHLGYRMCEEGGGGSVMWLISGGIRHFTV